MEQLSPHSSGKTILSYFRGKKNKSANTNCGDEAAGKFKEVHKAIMDLLTLLTNDKESQLAGLQSLVNKIAGPANDNSDTTNNSSVNGINKMNDTTGATPLLQLMQQGDHSGCLF